MDQAMHVLQAWNKAIRGLAKRIGEHVVDLDSCWPERHHERLVFRRTFAVGSDNGAFWEGGAVVAATAGLSSKCPMVLHAVRNGLTA